MENDGFVEVDEMDEEFMNEKEFDSDDSKPWDWENRLYEEWRDGQMMSEMEEE